MTHFTNPSHLQLQRKDFELGENFNSTFESMRTPLGVVGHDEIISSSAILKGNQ
jgi:hypothetical protein